MSVTAALAEYVTHSTYDAIPRDVRDEAKRAIFIYLGCALGGSIVPALDVAVRTLAPFSGNATACVLGRVERFDPLHAALMNGIGSHVHEYDDTLPKNYIHASVPVGSALFAWAAANGVSGREFVHAFALGFEVESRIGNDGAVRSIERNGAPVAVAPDVAPAHGGPGELCTLPAVYAMISNHYAMTVGHRYSRSTYRRPCSPMVRRSRSWPSR